MINILKVNEWYREGCCGGGYYQFTAGLIDGAGNVVKSYKTEEIGRIYRNNTWEQEGTTFTDYGPGIRKVFIESKGKTFRKSGIKLHKKNVSSKNRPENS